MWAYFGSTASHLSNMQEGGKWKLLFLGLQILLCIVLFIIVFFVSKKAIQRVTAEAQAEEIDQSEVENPTESLLGNTGDDRHTLIQN